MTDTPYPKRPERLVLESDVREMMEKKNVETTVTDLGDGREVVETRATFAIPKADPDYDQYAAIKSMQAKIKEAFPETSPVPDTTLSCSDGTCGLGADVIPVAREMMEKKMPTDWTWCPKCSLAQGGTRDKCSKCGGTAYPIGQAKNDFVNCIMLSTTEDAIAPVPRAEIEELERQVKAARKDMGGTTAQGVVTETGYVFPLNEWTLEPQTKVAVVPLDKIDQLRREAAAYDYVDPGRCENLKEALRILGLEE